MEKDETPSPPNGDGREEAEAREETEEAEAAEPESTPEPDAEGNDTTENLNSSTDGVDFAARYQSLKERDMKRLAQEMEERNSPAKSKKKKRNRIIKTILMVLLIALSIGIMFGISKYVNEDESKGFADMIRGINVYYLLALLATFFGYILFESMKYAYLLKISTGKLHLKHAVKTMFLGNYYDGITPLGTGGQPFQIYYLHKRNVPAGVATAIPLVKYIVTTFVLGIFSTVLISFAPHYFRQEGVNHALWITLIVVASISLAGNMLIPIIMIFVSAFPKAGKKLIAGIVRFLHKIKIVKRKYSVMKKYVYEVQEYRGAMKLLVRKWWRLIPLVIITVIAMALNFTLPFFTATAIGGVTPTASMLLQIWCFASVSYYSASLVPTPGSSGATEATSSIVFAYITGLSHVGWVMLVWRFTTFYFYILAGVCMSIFNMIRGAVRAKRAKRTQ